MFESQTNFYKILHWILQSKKDPADQDPFCYEVSGKMRQWGVLPALPLYDL